jgi:RNA polymerase sigma-70 factor, ECF subfamily
MGDRGAATAGDVPVVASDMSRAEPTATPGRAEPAVTGDGGEQLRRLMAEYGGAVYATCVRILRDRVLAEDVLQRVFLDAHRDLDRFQGRSTIRTWLIGIATHRCQDAMKARRRREKRFHTDEHAVINAADPSSDVEGPLDRARVGKALEDCLGELSGESRAAVLMRFHAGMSYEEMADAVGDNPGTLRKRVIRALPVVRRCLENKGWTGE